MGILNKHFDKIYYINIQKISNCYSIYPGISHQRAGYYDIMNKEVNYKSLIKQ